MKKREKLANKPYTFLCFNLSVLSNPPFVGARFSLISLSIFYDDEKLVNNFPIGLKNNDLMLFT